MRRRSWRAGEPFGNHRPSPPCLVFMLSANDSFLRTGKSIVRILRILSQVSMISTLSTIAA